MAIDHDVDVVTDRFAHGGHASGRRLDSGEPFDGHRRRDRHRLERREAIADRLLASSANCLALSTGVL